MVRANRLVYSTDPAEQARLAGRVARPTRPAADPVPPRDRSVRLSRERGGRGGKTVTVIRGLPGRAGALHALVAELRRACGAGGTVRDGAIEIQGDHRDRLAERLRALGHAVTLMGG